MLNSRLSDVKFLLVDDLDENLFAFEESLRRDGLTVISVQSGAAALEALLVHDFALAIVDVEMPGMDGVELAELMRGSERTRHVPIIFVTAGMHERQQQCRGYEAGAVDFLYKPLDPLALRNKAQTFFDLYRQQQQLGRQLELLREQQRRLEERNRELAAAQEESRRARDVAEATNRAKDEFLANVSHEIRTPMNAVLGMTELVLDTALDEGQRRALKTVHSAASKLLGTIDDLLDFSKIEAGKLELDPSEFSLHTEIGQTLGALSLRAHGKGLELLGDIAPNVPDRLLGDAPRLGQILTNLIGNAIKFTERGEVALRVTLRERGSNGVRVGFAVSDTGIGIPLDKQRTIFGAFEQQDTSTTRKYGGTGLGLTIAARLIALMGGELNVESVLGRGSTFAFEANFVDRSERAERSRPFAPQPVLAAQPWQSILSASRSWDRELASSATDSASSRSQEPPVLRVLVAEDNEFNSELLLQLLARRGHRVRLASTGREALRLVEAGGHDLLLLDVHMPELDGFSVIRAIRQREASTGGRLPVIAVTARARQEDRERCLKAGMDDFLVKPVSAAKLWESIARVTTRV
ncbi:MAG: response regulator [Polyangiaceae bacterium]